MTGAKWTISPSTISGGGKPDFHGLWIRVDTREAVVPLVEKFLSDDELRELGYVRA